MVGNVYVHVLPHRPLSLLQQFEIENLGTIQSPRKPNPSHHIQRSPDVIDDRDFADWTMRGVLVSAYVWVSTACLVAGRLTPLPAARADDVR